MTPPDKGNAITIQRKPPVTIGRGVCAEVDAGTRRNYSQPFPRVDCRRLSFGSLKPQSVHRVPPRPCSRNGWGWPSHGGPTGGASPAQKEVANPTHDPRRGSGMGQWAMLATARSLHLRINADQGARKTETTQNNVTHTRNVQDNEKRYDHQ